MAADDQFGNITTEWRVLKEKWFSGEPVDPVFEGIVRDFAVFDETIQDVYKKVEVFMKGVDSLAEGLVVLSEATMMQVDDAQIKSDCCKMKEATNQITRADAPHSAIAKLRRDTDFNIMNPIRNHLINNRNLKAELEKRRRKLLELNVAKKAFDDCVKRNYSRTDRRYLSAQVTLETAKMNFHEVDKHIFEWLYILEEYKGDILDSTLQTLKYLQYEFFATAAHAISSVLPAKMEFRPMVEMTPEHLEAQVDLELQEADENEDADEIVTDFSVKLIEKLAKDNKTKPGDGLDSCAGNAPAVAVDPLSLSSLLSQGFEEGPARQALRKHNNNTQAALDYLIQGGDGEDDAPPEDKVRMPTTVKRVQRLKAKRRAQLEKRRRNDGDDRPPSSATQSQAQSQEAPSRPAPAPQEEPVKQATKPPPPAQDLLAFDAAESSAPKPQAANNLLDFDEPPPPTDFTTSETTPLPVQRSFDLSMCEKQPLPASVAAGTAQLREPASASNGLEDLSMPGPGGVAASASASMDPMQSALSQLAQATVQSAVPHQPAMQMPTQPPAMQMQSASGSVGYPSTQLDPFASLGTGAAISSADAAMAMQAPAVAAAPTPASDTSQPAPNPLDALAQYVT